MQRLDIDEMLHRAEVSNKILNIVYALKTDELYKKEDAINDLLEFLLYMDYVDPIYDSENE